MGSFANLPHVRELTVTDIAHPLPESRSVGGQNQPPDAALNSQSLAFLEEKYADYLRDPEHVPADWRRYFDGMRDGADGHFLPAAEIQSPRQSLFHGPPGGAPATASAAIDNALLQERVDRLVHAYRVRGHIAA